MSKWIFGLCMYPVLSSLAVHTGKKHNHLFSTKHKKYLRFGNKGCRNKDKLFILKLVPKFL
jgi:hypothetical protein